jgi:hypothetical protein
MSVIMVGVVMLCVIFAKCCGNAEWRFFNFMPVVFPSVIVLNVILCDIMLAGSHYV